MVAFILVAGIAAMLFLSVAVARRVWKYLPDEALIIIGITIICTMTAFLLGEEFGLWRAQQKEGFFRTGNVSATNGE